MSLVLFSMLVYLYAFWCAYVLVMGIYRAHLSPARAAPLADPLDRPAVLLGAASLPGELRRGNGAGALS